MPELVFVFLFLRPLDYRLLFVAATVVQRLEGVAVHQLVNIFPHRPQLPNLAGIVLLRIAQKDAGFPLDALVIVQHQATGRSNLIGLLSVKGLRLHQAGHQQKTKQ